MTDQLQLTDEEAAELQRLQTDFPYWAENCVQIEGKAPGQVIPLEFNQAQMILWETRLYLLALYGYVRLIIVKGRQQGVSTFIEMLFLWIAYWVANVKICIISHEADSSLALFGKATFALKNLPAPLQLGKLPTDNVKSMTLPNGSSYMVLTAGSKEAGRSRTAHYQHQSERAFFEDHEAIDAGAGQIVAEEPGTEVYKESTANGMNVFHQEVVDGVNGRGKFRVLFIPWFVEPKYRTKPNPGFIRTSDEEELLKNYATYTNPFTGTVYPGLVDDWQLQWRRDKIIELKSLRKFRQEYPNYLEEAFQLPNKCFFNLDHVEKALHSQVRDRISPLILGCDVGRTGDRTAIVLRRGRTLEEIHIWDTMDSVTLYTIIANMIRKKGVDAAFIDWGLGQGTIDLLLSKGKFNNIVQGVHFGGKSSNPLYANKRAEMFFEVAEWFNWEQNGEVAIAQDAGTQDEISALIADIQAIPDWKSMNGAKMGFPEKEVIRKDYGMSPDVFEAFACTFAYPVMHKMQAVSEIDYYSSNHIEVSESSVLRDFQDPIEQEQYRDKLLWYDPRDVH